MKLNFKKRLPEEWKLDQIGNRITLNYGKSQSKIRAIDGDIPIYGTGGLMEFGTQFLSQGDSVIIGRKGTLDNPLYINHPFWTVDTAYYTSDFDGSTKWFYYLVQTIGLAELNEATGVPSLARDTFYKLKIPFPPKEEQQQIAKILDTVDKAIAQTETLIAKYKRVKTGLMQDLLTRGIDENGQLRDRTTHKFKRSPLGMIPDEWDVYYLKDLTLKIIDGVHHTPKYVDSGIPFVTVKNLTASESIDLSEINYITPEDHKNFIKRVEPCPGDILVSKDGTLGVARIIPQHFPIFSIFVSVALLRPNLNICKPELILFFFESGTFEYQLGKLSAGTGLRHIHLEHFQQFQNFR
jgi:type I restriction enzyme S subunit